MTRLKSLQNGSDIRGIATNGISNEHPNLDANVAKSIGIGFLKFLNNSKNTKKIAIGMDSRISSFFLKNAIISTLKESVQVFDCGLASTPAMFMSTIFKEFDCDGAIMVTASHLPFNRNGFKFFTKNGGLDKKDITQILEYAEEIYDITQPIHPVLDVQVDSDGNIKMLPSTNETNIPEIQPIDLGTERSPLMARYCKHLRDIIKEETNPNMPLDGLSILVDAGNGAGGFFATDVLAPLGANIKGSQFLNPNGTFPNHVPNPENKKAMESISEAVIKNNSDLGLIFDTDVDRSAAVDKYGEEISRNGIVALAASLIAEDYPGSTIVTDSITSNGLTEFIENELGLKHLRFKRGYRNVINKSIALNKAGTISPLAIETSGHAALSENYFLDDGAYLATKIVIKAKKLSDLGKTIDSLICNLKKAEFQTEVRFPILVDNFKEFGDELLSDLEAHVIETSNTSDSIKLVTPNYEGVRIQFENGWCLLRKSLHDPIMPLNYEASTTECMNEIRDFLYAFLIEYPGLDIENL